MAEEARELERERAARAALEAQVTELRLRLLEAEQRLARIGELELELRFVATDRDRAIIDRDSAKRVQAQMTGSLSWRVTKVLRLAKRRLH